MTGAGLRAGVIGWPVEHSKSPRLHSAWLRRYGIDGAYTHLPTPPGDLRARVDQLVKDGWRGANVTIPHKEEALSLAHEATERATEIGAANTLIFRDGGHILADNTDGFGFTENLIDQAADLWRPDGAALVIGAGGASRAVIWALLNAGAAEVRLINRTRARAEALMEAFGPRVVVMDWDRIADALPGASLIVNATSLGMSGEAPLTLDLEGANPEAVATDLVYTPLITPFLDIASVQGLRIVDGLGMLLHQARPGFEAWFGRAPEVDDEIRTLMLSK